MKNIIILSAWLLSFKLSAQNVELTIEPNSIKVQNDYLYFKFRLQNNSDSVLAFRDAGSMVDVATSEEPDDWYMNVSSSGLSCFIYDENDRFRPRTFTGLRDYWPVFDTITQTFKTILSYEDSINYIYRSKYIILSPGRFVEYDRRLEIGKFIMGEKLEKGTYKFRLKYGFFSDYYREGYLIAKETDESLKGSFLFEGEIWSDFYLFEYP